MTSAPSAANLTATRLVCLADPPPPPRLPNVDPNLGTVAALAVRPDRSGLHNCATRRHRDTDQSGAGGRRRYRCARESLAMRRLRPTSGAACRRPTLTPHMHGCAERHYEHPPSLSRLIERSGLTVKTVTTRLRHMQANDIPNAGSPARRRISDCRAQKGPGDGHSRNGRPIRSPPRNQSMVSASEPLTGAVS